MSSLTYTDYPGFGEFARKNIGYRSAVRIGDQIHCSGQGGWIFDTTNDTFSWPPTLAEQIDKAFENVNAALRAAGGKGWEQVYRLNSYHLNLDAETTKIMSECFKKYAGEHQFIWTEIGVAKLGAEGMDVELEVCAYLA